MKWLIVFYMAAAEPFSVNTLEFESRNLCVDYVNNPSNANRLAIEVISIAGFNDTIQAVVCLPENEIKDSETNT